MKLSRIGVGLFLLFLIGITIFTRILIKQEEKRNVQNMMNKGNYLVSLIALHTIGNFAAERGEFFLRTLTQYTSYEGLAYFFVEDHKGQAIISFAPGNIASQIPRDIQMKSLHSMALIPHSNPGKGRHR